MGNLQIIAADVRELWGFKSFRARVFFAIIPTAIAFVFGLLATDRVRPYDYIPEGSFIVPTSGKGGDQVTVHWHVRQNRTKPCPGIVERLLIDPSTDVVLATYDPVLATPMPPVKGYLNVTFAMPRNMQAGVVGYRAKMTYTCNWLQAVFPTMAIKYSTPTLLFTVVE